MCKLPSTSVCVIVVSFIVNRCGLPHYAGDRFFASFSYISTGCVNCRQPACVCMYACVIVVSFIVNRCGLPHYVGDRFYTSLLHYYWLSSSFYFSYITTGCLNCHPPVRSCGRCSQDQTSLDHRLNWPSRKPFTSQGPSSRVLTW